MNLFRQVLNMIVTALDLFFEDDTDVMSRTARQIFSNKEDKQKYIEAIGKINHGSKEETIILSTGEAITLI